MYSGTFLERHPDKPVLIMGESGEALTFAQYEANANRLAHYFRSVGLRRGDHVAFMVENHLNYFEMMAAAERSGLYYTAINIHLQAEEVAHIVKDCGAALVIASAQTLAVAREAVASAGDSVRHRLCLDLSDEVGGFLPYPSTVADFPATPSADEYLGTTMNYSSGTTGRPKGVLRSLPDAHPSETPALAKFVFNMFGFREGMVYLSPAPVYHSGPQVGVAGAIRLGATSIIMEHFDAELYLSLIDRYAVTHTQAVPSMFVRMLRLPEDVRRHYDVSSLEVLHHAAAPCPVHVKEKMLEWLGPIIIESYGATEGIGFTFCTADEWKSHPGTVGKPIRGVLRILDEDGHAVPTGEVGTVWFESEEARNFEYHNDPERTAECHDESGRCATVGDVGYVDDDGFLYLTDRKAYTIISGGVNIYPQEIEDALLAHPAIADVAVFGVPNADFGEEVKAVVECSDGYEGSADLEIELIEFCRSRLAKYKCPRSVDFTAQLPRQATGKLFKRLLRDQYWKKHAADSELSPA